MHYRRNTDVHVQLDPPSFSLSLNLIPKARARSAGAFDEQYEFDIPTSTVSRLLPGLATRQADLITIAAEVGCYETDQIVEELFTESPNRRTRAACLRYLVRRQPWRTEEWSEIASNDSDATVRHEVLKLHAHAASERKSSNAQLLR